ncbi:cation diffusion facilitator family transporter [candidate division KSB1 bacterium]|nr:cation diffusion facilitator family transporter [candidate division KSB1 bacterium]
MNKNEKLKQGQRLALIATIITLLLSLLKGVVGYLFHSKILVADAFHSGADTIAIFASAFGLWLASRQKSARFPYGLYKAETIGTLLIGGFIFWAGVELCVDGFGKLTQPTIFFGFPWLPAIVTILSIVVAFFIARKEKVMGEKIQSQSLIANARESFLDIWSSVVVLAGILLSYLRIPYVEALIIMLISLLILKLGAENIWNSLLALMDANLDRELQQNIEQIVRNVYGVKQMLKVNVRQTGPFRMVDVTFTANPSLTLFKAHELADEVERKITSEYDFIESVFIHVEPSKQQLITAIIPVEDISGFQSKVYAHFGRAPFYVILKMENDQVEIEDFYLNEFLDKEKHIGLNVVKVIVNYGLDMLFTARIGEISFHILKDSFIDIYKIEEKNLTVSNVITLYQRNQLARITEPTHTTEEAMVN